MRKLLATAILVLVAAPPALAAEPATLLLSASSTVEATPDSAKVTAAVVTQAADAATALADNATRMNDVLGALRRAGVDGRAIGTTGLSLQPRYRYPDGEPPQLTGFEAENRIEVTLADANAVGRIVDALVKAGANRIDGPVFMVKDADALLDKARREAVEKARQRAALYAEAAGLRVVAIRSIREDGGGAAPQPLPRLMAVQAAPTPVRPGLQSLAATVTMEFELAPR